MCIAIAKPMGIQVPSDEIFNNCFDNNRDGAGFSYAHNNKVVIIKGLMTKEDFAGTLKTLKETIGDLTDVPMLYHFRIGTQGGNSEGNTHPFPLSKSKEELKALILETDISMIHNGIISETSSYSYKQKFPELSDTQVFCSEFLKDIVDEFTFERMFNSKLVNKIIDHYLGSGRFAFLDKLGTITRFGNWVEDEGVFYSNSTYKKSRYVNVGGKSIDRKTYFNNYNQGYVWYSGKTYDELEFNTVPNTVTTILKENEFETEKPKTKVKFIEEDDNELFGENFLVEELKNVDDWEILNTCGEVIGSEELKDYGKLYIDELGIMYTKDKFGLFEVDLFAIKIPKQNKAKA